MDFIFFLIFLPLQYNGRYVRLGMRENIFSAKWLKLLIKELKEILIN